jgi:hypothetical protein
MSCVALTAILGGCSGGGSNGIPKISSTNPLTSGVLQFAVGTANLYGTASGLNVVSTYRQSDGLSNVLVDTPTITGPFTLPASAPAGNFRIAPNTGASVDAYSTLADAGSGSPSGPSVEEVAAGGRITGTSQSVHLGTPDCDQTTPCTVASATGGNVTIPPNTSTFGQAGGVFVNGISPGNSTTSGQSATYEPYTEPLYDTTTGNGFIPFGGPPAFDPNKDGLGLRDGLSNLGGPNATIGVLGIPLGISTFYGVIAAPGSYLLSLQVPTGFSGTTPTYGTASKSASLTSTAKLGTITAPVLALDGKGGGTFTVAALPAGVTEELVEITDMGDGSDAAETCQGPLGATVDTAGGGAGPVFYTILVKAPGTYTLADSIGPNTTVSSGVGTITPSPSICTAAQNTTALEKTDVGDSYTVQAIGADYPLYESLYPNNKSQTPAIVGANGQADITISAVSATATSLAHARSPGLRRMR